MFEDSYTSDKHVINIVVRPAKHLTALRPPERLSVRKMPDATLRLFAGICTHSPESRSLPAKHHQRAMDRQTRAAACK